MYKYIVGNLIYIFWTLLNVSQDSIFKYSNHLPLSFIFLIRYVFVFLITLIIIKMNKIHKNITYENKKNIIILNFFKSIVTMLGMIFVYKQIEISSLFSLNLIFFSITFFDLIIEKIILNPSKNFNLKSFILENLEIFLNNLIIFIYFLKEVYFYGIFKIFYGFLVALMFSISNIFILKTKETWCNNFKFMFYDIFYFSLYMIILSIFYYKINFSLILNNFYHIWDLSFITYIILGVLIQFLLYYLFFKNNFTPSSILVSIDLIASLIFGFFCNNEKVNFLETLIILFIIIIPFVKKKILNK